MNRPGAIFIKFLYRPARKKNLTADTLLEPAQKN